MEQSLTVANPQASPDPNENQLPVSTPPPPLLIPHPSFHNAYSEFDFQNNNPKGFYQSPGKPFPGSFPPPELSILQDISYLILKTNLVPVNIGIPYSDEALKFDVFDETGRRLFIICETSKSCKICSWKTDRPCVFYVLDSSGKRIFTITRPFECLCCFGVGCLGDTYGNEVRVKMEDQVNVGSVSQKYCCCNPIYVLRNGNGEMFDIKGPPCGFCCPCRMGCAAQFSIFPEMKPIRKVGEIKQAWKELSRVPVFSDGDNFGASFPKDWDVRAKATMLGALLLINFLHYDFDPCAPSQYCW